MEVQCPDEDRWKRIILCFPENMLTTVDVKLTPQITFGVPKKLFKAYIGFFHQHDTWF